jgi:hypothetical protein
MPGFSFEVTLQAGASLPWVWAVKNNFAAT